MVLNMTCANDELVVLSLQLRHLPWLRIYKSPQACPGLQENISTHKGFFTRTSYHTTYIHKHIQLAQSSHR